MLVFLAGSPNRKEVPLSLVTRLEEIDGRNIRVGDKWLVDFASCNYLGFDLDPEIMGSIDEYVRAWGTHPSWSRLLGSPVLYEQIEADLSELLDAEDTLALPTITLIHMAIVPVLAGAGTIYLDGRAHKTLYEFTGFGWIAANQFVMGGNMD